MVKHLPFRTKLERLVKNCIPEIKDIVYKSTEYSHHFVLTSGEIIEWNQLSLALMFDNVPDVKKVAKLREYIKNKLREDAISKCKNG